MFGKDPLYFSLGKSTNYSFSFIYPTNLSRALDTAIKTISPSQQTGTLSEFSIHVNDTFLKWIYIPSSAL